MLRKRRRQRHPRTNHPARPRERRGPQPAVVLTTGQGEGRGRGARARGGRAGGGEWREEGHHTENGNSQRAGSRARRRTKATEATGQGARSTSARVGHHAAEQDTLCARGGSRDAGRGHLTPVIRTSSGSRDAGRGVAPHLRSLSSSFRYMMPSPPNGFKFEVGDKLQNRRKGAFQKCALFSLANGCYDSFR